MDNLNSSVEVSVSAGALRNNAGGGISPTTQNNKFATRVNYSFGVGSGQINEYYINRLEAVANGTTTLDLRGVLTNALNEGVDLARIKAVVFESIPNADESDLAAEIIIRPNATNPAQMFFSTTSSGVRLRAGGFVAMADPLLGFALTATTGDQLDFVNADATKDFAVRITFLGTDA